MSQEPIEQRIDRLHAQGIVDLHFDLPFDLYEKRNRPGQLTTHYLPEFKAGNIGVVGAAIYIEDKYLPEMGLRVGLGQIAQLYSEVANAPQFAVCRTHDEILRSRAAPPRCAARRMCRSRRR